MIYTSFYYKNKLEKEEYHVRENRFIPGSAFEVFPVWYQYIRKWFPDEHIIIFNNISPITIEEGLSSINEPYEIIDDKIINHAIKIHVHKFKTEYFYFHSVQRNHVAALNFAYYNNDNYLWIDTDCLLNSDIRKFYKEKDVWVPTLLHHQMTIDAHCTYISQKRLHEMDSIYKLPDFLNYILNEAPDDNQSVRHHTLFEGGMYKLFCYGNYGSNLNINMTHACCYKEMMTFLLSNPLQTKEYEKLVYLYQHLNIEKLKGVQMDFTDGILTKEI